MKKFRFFVLLGIIGLLVPVGFSQSRSPRIGIVNLADSVVTHVYFDPMHNIYRTEDIFDYGDYTVNDLISRFSGSQIEAVKLSTPFWFGRMDYLNFVGKPTKKLKAWLTALRQQNDIDYLIVVLHKWNPDPDINFKFLDGKHYGIVSYATNRYAITLFSLVGYYIFSTKDFSEVSLNPNHDKYVITNVSLIDGMSFTQLMNLPDQYFKLCQDKLRNIADTRDTEIWRVLMEEINK
jgi:hypothetical protein